MSENKYRSLCLAGDKDGLPVLLKHLPVNSIKCIIAAGNHIGYIEEIKQIAVKYGLNMLVQPDRSETEYQDFVSKFKSFNIDLLLCYSYSMKIDEDILNSAGYNAINIHASLLPRNRGPNPVQWAIIRDEGRTGVTVHYMNQNIDSGDIIAQREVEIEETDSWCSLKSKLAKITENLLIEEFPKILSGLNMRIKQDKTQATYNCRIDADYPRIDFKTMSDRHIYNLIRAQIKPLKGAYVEYMGKRVYFNEFIEYKDIGLLREKYA